MAADETAGASYGKLIADQLAEERTRKASLEQRGITVITTSGVLVSLLFGLAALITSAEDFDLPDGVRPLLVAGLVFFVGAAVSGIWLNSPRKYREANPGHLRRLTQKQIWEASASLGARRGAELQANLISTARTVNASKAKWLVAAILLEVLGIGAVASGVVVILVSS